MSQLLSSIVSNRDYLAALSLLAALACNWGLGVLTAIVRGEFSWQALPRILRSQLASTELKVIYATYGGSLATAVVAYFLAHSGLIDHALLVFVVARLIDVAAAASALYSAALWREVLVQVGDLLAAIASIGTSPKPAKLNQPRSLPA